MIERVDPIFFGSPFLRWSLGITAFVSALGFAFLMTDLRGLGLVAGIAFEAVLVLLFLAMLSPARCLWAARGVCAIVFLAFVAYAVDMAIRAPGTFWPPTARRSESTGYNALCGLLVIGLPALLFAVYRRTPPGPEAELADCDLDDEFPTEADVTKRE